MALYERLQQYAVYNLSPLRVNWKIMTALAFDVYGTLIDTAGVTHKLEQFTGDKAAAFSTLWRTKQLEYTWRYGLMGAYENFQQCTSQALNFCCASFDISMTDSDKLDLMAFYLQLPVFDDVMEGLERLKSAGIPMVAFSNGIPEDLSTLLSNAQILDYMDGIVSVDDKKTFKPDPVVYHYCQERTGQETWLVSSNGFDICGAKAAGMAGIWVQRDSSVQFDDWQYQPRKVVSSFTEMAEYSLNNI